MEGSLRDIDPRTVADLATTGMLPSLYAQAKPDEISVFSERGERTFGQINENANRLSDLMHKAGMKPGDHFALLCPNVPEFVEVFAMNMRSGFRIIPINWHLQPDEVRYILHNSDAKAFISHADFAETAVHAAVGLKHKVRLAIGGPIPGFADYRLELDSANPTNPVEPIHGTQMLYTSGTTGRPKGVLRPLADPRRPQWGLGTRKAYRPEGDVTLCCGPAYHSAPLSWAIWDPLVAGVPIVLTEKFGAEKFLATIERYKVTHTNMVSTMFQRLLALPPAVRTKFDLSSLRCIQHGAAPTPPEVKRAMMDWFGPILHEYFGASEGSGNYYITAQEWLQKPGSVGKRNLDWGSRVLNDANEETSPGEVGRIFFRHIPNGRFVYYGDPEKSDAVTLGGTHFTVGDMGYLDEDDYLFLTGRSAECIISGGVNIYPQEIDNELLQHPAVAQACTVGIPNDEWGEEVRAVVTLRTGHATSAADLLQFLRHRLAAYKLPRDVDFVTEIPCSEAGKVLRNIVRAPYWAGRAKQI